MSETAVNAVPAMGMITLRGDHAQVGSAIMAQTGCPIPSRRLHATAEAMAVLWMSPDELLIMCDHDTAPALADRLEADLQGIFALVAVVSDARQVFDITGPYATEALQKLCPVDFAKLAPFEVRRTRLAQVPAALWQIENGWRIVCFRSVARYADDLLTNAIA